MSGKGFTRRLIDHVLSVEYEDLPAAAVEAQKQSLADMLAVMLAATGLDAASAPFAALAAEGQGRCTILGRMEKTTPTLAALANGALVHALDYEDSHEVATVHPNSAALPALMALSQHLGNVSGKRFLTAMALASDICCRLDLAVNEDLLKYGWNMPPVHGSMGAVLGAGKLLGLDAGQLADALALNLCQATCTGEAANSAGSALRSVREGFAAQAAVQSALLADRGVLARLDEPFEGRLGYYHMYARDNYTPEKALGGLGTVFQGAFISFKPWPACRATHTSIEGTLSLMEEHHIRPEEIREIHIVLQEIGRMVTEPRDAKYRPQSSAVAKFSLPFVVGTAVIYGAVGLDSFTPERLNDQAVLAMGDKVICEIDPTLTKEQNKYTDITIITDRGAFYRHLEHPLGCVEHPMGREVLRQKFFDCAARASRPYPGTELEAIYDDIWRLEELEDVDRLFSRL
ncbi:MmgE/PrpD family protein [Intestinimonas sp.]|uniref:MmgE/PrpD family protein n=1 Tax=Intestinimonas sp. TaxID=1965293 RepID=UPI002607C99C|nr:MmgE/PrpD family protein [Intestinimonas sp.]